MWNKYTNETIPPVYDVLGGQVSKNMLTYNILTRTSYIASFWVTGNKKVWRDYSDGREIVITHWQEINLPKD